MKDKVKAFLGVAGEFSSGMGKRKLTVFATSGCYYLFMSLVPLVMIMCCILPYTPFNQELILYYIDAYFAESLGEILRSIANAVYSSNAATLTVSILLTLFSASASMKALMKGMDAAYECENKDNIVVFTLRALIYMVLLVITLVLSLVIMVYGGKILMLLRRYLVNVGILNTLLSKGRYVLVMLILGIVFTMLYTLMPAMKVKIRNQIPGAVFTAVTWVLFSWGFTLYIGLSDKYGAYGFIGTIMVAMMWMYYCLFFLLIGGYMNSYLTAKQAAPDALPQPGAENGTAEAETAGDGEGISEDGQKQDVLAMTSEEMDSFLEEEEEEEKKKLPLPILIGGCAAAALGAIFFIVFRKKKKAKAAALAAKNAGILAKIFPKKQ